MKILLVEDNLLNQKIVLYNLQKHNYSIIAVTNGQEALNSVLNEEFDLILMDIMLPEMNGFEITEKIRQMENENNVVNKVPIIAITANTLDNDREKCFNAGMNEYLSKPFTANQLLEKIEKFIQPEKA